MQEKINQLLEILDVAKKNVPPEFEAWKDHKDSFDVHILELELGEDKPMNERLGVSKGVFPPVEQLEDDELILIVDKILELWGAHHYYAEILEGYPARKAYPLLLSVWEEPVPVCTVGGYHFDFYSDEDLHEYLESK